MTMRAAAGGSPACPPESTTRVLMVSDVYFPRVNGVSTSMHTFRQALAERGVRVDLIVPRYGDEADTEGVIRVPGRALPNDPEDRLLSWKAMHRTVLEQSGSYDLIHIQTPFVAHYAGVAAARKHGLPVVTSYHTLFEEYLQHYVPALPASWLRGLARQFSRRQCNAVDAVVVPSAAMASRLANYGVTTTLEVLPTGIPLARLAHGNGAVFRSTHAIQPERPLALFVGRVAHEKNIGFLLQALVVAHRSCPSALLLITGDGPAKAALQQHAAQLGIADSVRFMGYLDRDTELPDCYAAADAFVFASRTETQGLVLLEALAAGTPVIALAAMGTTDIVANAPGCLSPPDDPHSFGLALGKLLADPELRASLAAQAKRTAASWSDTEMAARLAAFYQRLLAPRAQPASRTDARSERAGAGT